jgi:hypothetical protein
MNSLNPFRGLSAVFIFGGLFSMSDGEIAQWRVTSYILNTIDIAVLKTQIMRNAGGESQ